MSRTLISFQNHFKGWGGGHLNKRRLFKGGTKRFSDVHVSDTFFQFLIRSSEKRCPPPSRNDTNYAPGKWTLKVLEVIVLYALPPSAAIFFAIINSSYDFFSF